MLNISTIIILIFLALYPEHFSSIVGYRSFPSKVDLEFSIPHLASSLNAPMFSINILFSNAYIR